MKYSDSELKQEVLSELKWSPAIRSTNVGVTVKDGAVTLNGFVDSYTEKIAAENAAKRVKGVKAIAQEIEVKTKAKTEGSDEEIAEQAANILRWNVSLKECDIQARVSRGLVTLTGEVYWLFQKRVAKSRISDLNGVLGVFDNMTIKKEVASVSPADIKSNINRALHRRANLESSKVALSVVGNEVTLSGSVDSFYERELIEDAVWNCKGVSKVVDNLEVA